MGETINEKKIKRYTRALQKINSLRRTIEKDTNVPTEFFEILCVMYIFYKEKINELEVKKDGQ